MKIRTDFVTNSSSSSFIICFARVVDEEKAQKIINEFNVKTYTAEEIEDEKYFGYLGADWAGVYISVDEILKNHPDAKYIIIRDYNEGIEHDWDDIEYNYNFDENEAIESVTEENGFADIYVETGEGRNG